MNQEEKFDFNPVSVVVAGPFFYMVYFEQKDNQVAFEFEVDPATGIVSWQKAFDIAMGGNLTPARPLIDCISSLDRIITDRLDSRDGLMKFSKTGLIGTNTADTMVPASESVPGSLADLSAFKRKRRVSEQEGAQEFKPLSIEFTMPGLYRVEYLYGGMPSAVYFSVSAKTVDVETVDQKRWFAMENLDFSAELFQAIRSLEEARSNKKS